MPAPKQKYYDIFISYRRDGGFETANLIAEKLRRAGYSVFFDVEALRSGKFNEQLFSVIERCKDFIIVLPEGSLDRCANPEDWVRKETLHAQKHGKNIIPVLLRNFKWPETLPAELDELPHYQSITAGEAALFDASIQLLKGYLHSHRSHVRQFMRAGISIGIVLAILLVVWLALLQMAVPVCYEQASAMTLKMTKLDLLTTLVVDTGKEWNDFYEKYQNAAPDMQKRLSNGMRLHIGHSRKEMAKWRETDAPFSLNARQQFLLQIRGVDIADLEVFHNMLYPETFTGATHHLDLMEGFLNFDGGIPKISVDSNNRHIEHSKHIANAFYYAYMGFLSTMPEKARKTHFEGASMWVYFSEAIPNVDFSHESSFYELRAKSEIAAAERIVSSVGYLTTQQQHELNKEERDFNQKKQELENRAKEEFEKNRKEQEAALQAEVEQRFTRIKAQVAENMKLQQELQKATGEMEEMYRRMLKKTEHSDTDDLGLAWGKICQLAGLMEHASNARRVREEMRVANAARAKADGRDTLDDYFPINYTLTMDEVLQTLQTRLIRYGERFPETKGCIPAVSRFYADVCGGKRSLTGLLVVCTKDDVPHPVFKTGDIVLRRRGKLLHSVEDYTSVGNSKSSTSDEIQLLRMTASGVLEEQTATIPRDTSVLVGFQQVGYPLPPASPNK